MYELARSRSMIKKVKVRSIHDRFEEPRIAREYLSYPNIEIALNLDAPTVVHTREIDGKTRLRFVWAYA